MSALGRNHRADSAKAAYRDSEGRKWAYRGKRALVLEMLVERAGGITQHDTLPWHTRLGGTIHALREDGLTISTEIEGPYRHARYRLRTRLVGDETPGEHRVESLKNYQRISSRRPAGRASPDGRNTVI